MRMVVPKSNVFAPQPPEETAENDVLGVHVYEDRVVFVAQLPRE